MITLTNGVTTQEGTVICGTMRVEHLIPTFLDEIERLQLPSVEQRALWDNIAYYVETGDGQASTVSQAYEWAMDLLNELFDILDSIAPDGYYFGAHPGDGSDYGYWQYEDSDNITVNFNSCAYCGVDFSDLGYDYNQEGFCSVTCADRVW